MRAGAGMRSQRLARLARGAEHRPAGAPRPEPGPQPERGAQTQPGSEPEPERCELCGEPIPAEHRHLVDLRRRTLLCACRACTILFDQPAAGGGHYRLVPDRRLALDDFRLDDPAWASLAIPVDMAFFFRSTAAHRVVAFYPSPMGVTESALALEAWADLEEANPVLAELEPDVEALLVNRAGEAREHFIVPVDDCYRLAGLIRTQWRGLAGGTEVWEAIGHFFDELRQGAIPARQGRAISDEEATWPA
jgi:Family of unknown function (DUF5947)